MASNGSSEMNSEVVWPAAHSLALLFIPLSGELFWGFLVSCEACEARLALVARRAARSPNRVHLFLGRTLGQGGRQDSALLRSSSEPLTPGTSPATKVQVQFTKLVATGPSVTPQTADPELEQVEHTTRLHNPLASSSAVI